MVLIRGAREMKHTKICVSKFHDWYYLCVNASRIWYYQGVNGAKGIYWDHNLSDKSSNALHTRQHIVTLKNQFIYDDSKLFDTIIKWFAN